jgi:hypothetical protein
VDVLLDSNIYLQDAKLAGNQFTELFTYLRRTGSRILLPHLVREEVSARSRYKLWDATRKLESARENLSKVKITAGPHFGSIDFDHELKLIDEKMHSPSKGVQVIDIDQYGGVDVKDVVIRGVRRKRPADENGEELRDVILWLLAIDLAERSEAGIIFISNDKGFKGEDGRLHPDLVREVALLKQPLEYYAEIRECVVAKALSQKPVDLDDLSSLIPVRKLEHLSLELVLRSQIPMGRIVGADIKELDFEEGTNYTVGQGAQFIEVRFHGSAIIVVEEFTQILSSGSYSIDMSGGTYLAEPWPTPTLLSPGQPAVQNAFVTSWKPIGSFWPGTYGYTEPVSANVFASPQPRRYTCSFRISFSARVRDGHLESIEPEGIKFVSFLADETQPKNPTSAG